MQDYQTPAATQGAACPGPGPVAKRKRILVMDDEATILELTARMLGSRGYLVDGADSGDAAVTQYRAAMEAGQPFDAVLLDLTVPSGMGGFDAFQAIRVFDPAVRAILSSGYSHEPVVLNYRKYGLAGVAPKPYKVGELVEAVEKVLRGDGQR